MAYASINPYTGETVATFQNATDDEVRAAIAAAHDAFLKWRQTSFAERGRILQNAADILRRDADAYADVITYVTGSGRCLATCSCYPAPSFFFSLFPVDTSHQGSFKHIISLYYTDSLILDFTDTSLLSRLFPHVHQQLTPRRRSERVPRSR